MERTLSRRRFLELIGAAGGSAAVCQFALALGLMPRRAAGAPGLVAPLGARKRSVVLLGGGLSSLMSAYELERAGYQCTVLEASHRIGGRNLTLRHGDRIDEIGRPQTCEFDDAPHLYFNAGPARIPGHHHYVLHYCRELGVPLEPFVNVNYNAWVRDQAINGGERIRFRHLVTDARGFLAELSAKAINGGAFEAPMNGEDVERVTEFLRAFGDLDPDSFYRGSLRAGLDGPGHLAPTPGMIDHGEMRERIDFSEFLRSSFWEAKMHFGEFPEQAAPLMQPVGGMDRIVDAFVRRLRSPIHTNALVKGVHVADDGVHVVYQNAGQHHEVRADYCFNCIPKHILLGLDTNFPAEYRKALAATGRGTLFKIGVQMSERFWEREQIYGGISWTDQPIVQIWYPTHGIHQQKGIVLGAYTFFPEQYRYFERMTREERIDAALSQGEALHPGYRRFAECAVVVDWYHMNHHLGCAAQWTEDAMARYLPTLQEPLNQRHFLTGDQVSLHPGWQEGAFSSAHHALQALQKRVAQETA